MTVVNLVVVGGALAITALLWRFFFGAKQSSRATVRAGAQEITVTVKGGYAPDRIEVHQGTPVRITSKDRRRRRLRPRPGGSRSPI